MPQPWTDWPTLVRAAAGDWRIWTRGAEAGPYPDEAAARAAGPPQLGLAFTPDQVDQQERLARATATYLNRGNLAPPQQVALDGLGLEDALAAAEGLLVDTLGWTQYAGRLTAATRAALLRFDRVMRGERGVLARRGDVTVAAVQADGDLLVFLPRWATILERGPFEDDDASILEERRL